MKKPFFIYLIALLITTGIFGYVVLSQNKISEKNTNSENSNKIKVEDTYAGWQIYTDERANFALKYPGDWKLDETNSLANKKIFYTEKDGKRYDFNIQWENSMGRYSCEQITEYRCQEALGDYYNKNLYQSVDEQQVEEIEADYYPIREVKLNDYSLCLLPDISLNNSQNEHYLIVNKKNIFDVTFSLAKTEAKNILEPEKNYLLAKEILNTLSFAKSETEIENWQEYKNEKMGYIINLPGTWFNSIKDFEVLCTVYGTGDCIEDGFTSIDPKLFQGRISYGLDFYIMRYKFSQDKSLEEIYKNDEDRPSEEMIKEAGFKIEVSDFQNFTLNGKEAGRYSLNAIEFTEPGYIEEVLIRNGDYVYDIEAIVGQKSYFESYRDEFEKILESFEII